MEFGLFAGDADDCRVFGCEPFHGYDGFGPGQEFGRLGFHASFPFGLELSGGGAGAGSLFGFGGAYGRVFRQDAVGLFGVSVAPVHGFGDGFLVQAVEGGDGILH